MGPVVASGWLGLRCVKLAVASILLVAYADPSWADMKPRLPDETREIGGLHYLMSDDERREYAALDDDTSRRRWLKAFWRSRDPVLTTPVNEMFVEHLRRVAEAESLFFVPEWPGWDQRGEVYIRYGRPGARQTMDSYIDETAHTPIIPARELWYYPSLETIVLFEDLDGDGSFTYYTHDVDAPPGVRSKGASQPLDALFRGIAGDLARGPDLLANVGAGQFEWLVNNFQGVLNTVPCEYEYSRRQNKVPLFFEVRRFSAGDAKVRLDVNVQFVAQTRSGETSGGATGEYELTVVYWDTDYAEVVRETRSIEVPTGSSDSLRLVPVQVSSTLSPGFYHMAIAILEGGTGNFASFPARVACGDFAGHFAVSDIMLSSRIRQTRGVSPFGRGALEVVPHPIRRYRNTMDIPVYIELYNLETDARGLSKYRVSYEIEPYDLQHARVDPNESDVHAASSYVAAAHGPRDHVHLVVRPTGLSEGKYRLRVTAQDTLSLVEATRETFFFIVSK